jgi:hypothetical protein
MRLLTRCDLDGLTCATLISLQEKVDEIVLTHPQEIADGRVKIGSDDILANLPFQAGCGLWFDHHLHTHVPEPSEKYKGACGQAPSAARLVYEYYGGRTTLADFEELVSATDRFDSADLTLDDILDPQGYVQLGFTADGRSGFGGEAEYFMTVLDLLTRRTPIAELMTHPEVAARCRRLEDEDVQLHALLQAVSRVDGNVVLSDFRGVESVPVGNRFLVFALFPQINVAVRVQTKDGRDFPMLTLGHSILNRTCRTDLGELAARYNGGGHRGAASIELTGTPDEQIREIVQALKEEG